MKLCIVVVSALAGGVWARPHIADCFGTYVDGGIFIDRHELNAGSIKGLDADVSFPLAFYQDNQSPEFLYSSLPLARKDSDQHWTVFKDVLYIDASPGAFAPVGFKDPDELTGGETDKYWSQTYGFIWWVPESDGSGWWQLRYQHIGGFVHVPVEGLDNVFQLYWNQTQFEEIDRGEQLYGPGPPQCWDGYVSTISYEDHP